MSDRYFLSTDKDDKTDGASFSFTAPEPERDCHVLERASYLPVSQANADSPELRRGVFHWPADASIQTQRLTSAAQFHSPPFLLPPTLHGSQSPSHGSDNSPLHFGSNAPSGAHPLIFECRPQTVAMPTPIGHARYGGGLIDAHTCHYDPSSGSAHDDYMVEYSPVTMPIVPTYFRAGVASYMDPVLPPDPAIGWSPGYPTVTYQQITSPDSALSPSPPGNFDSGSYSSSSSPPSPANHSPTLPFDTSDQIRPQSITIASLDPLYTLRVPLEAVEFPPISSAGELHFFQCCWEDCGIWITSDKEAVKDHLTRAHGVALKRQTDESARCRWVGCSRSLQRNGLVRHFHTHLSLTWLCSLCGGVYSRPDSVRSHAHREPRCELAQAISYPSPVAYRATGRNGDNTITLTKILQP